MYFRKGNLRKEVKKMYIFRPWITTKDGTRIYAKNYGKKAFRIWVDSDKKK